MILSKGGHTLATCCRLFAWKRLTKGAGGGGVTGTPGSPSFTLALNMQSTTEITAPAHHKCTSCGNVMLGDIGL